MPASPGEDESEVFCDNSPAGVGQSCSQCWAFRVLEEYFIVQGVLYREHQESEAVWEREREEIRREKEELMAIQQQQEVTLQELKVQMIDLLYVVSLPLLL